MKKAIATILILAIMFLSELAFAKGPMSKLSRGAANVVTSPVEIIYGMKEANETPGGSGLLSAFTWGVLNGVLRMGVRAVVGAYEIVTAPLPIPKGYKPIISDLGDTEIFLPANK